MIFIAGFFYFVFISFYSVTMAVVDMKVAMRPAALYVYLGAEVSAFFQMCVTSSLWTDDNLP